jgi:hypothetical protein
VTDRKKIGRILFDRPKPTVGCRASGRRRRIYIYIYIQGVKEQFLQAFSSFRGSKESNLG